MENSVSREKFRLEVSRFYGAPLLLGNMRFLGVLLRGKQLHYPCVLPLNSIRFQWKIAYIVQNYREKCKPIVQGAERVSCQCKK